MILSQVLDLVGIALALATLPLLAELLVLTVASLLPFTREVKQAGATEDFPITVLVPAYNEEALVGRCIRSMSFSADAGVDLVVIAHNCMDATATEAEAAGARVLVLNDPDRKGKGYALSYGFAAALSGPSRAVLVIDADSVVSAGLIAEVRQRFLAGAQAVQCRYDVYQLHREPPHQADGACLSRIQCDSSARPGAFGSFGGDSGQWLCSSPGCVDAGFHTEPIPLLKIWNIISHLVRAGIRVEFVDTATVSGEMPHSDLARANPARSMGRRQAADDETVGSQADGRCAARTSAADRAAPRSAGRADRHRGMLVTGCCLPACCVAQTVCLGRVSCTRFACNDGRRWRFRLAGNPKSSGNGSCLYLLETVDTS